MKYTILGFQQEKLIGNELNVDDALILRVIKDMYSTVGMDFKEINGERCMWINYPYFLKQIPIIGSRSNLMARIKKYEDKGFIVRNLENSRKGVKGSYAFISPTVKLDELQDYDHYPKDGHPLSNINITSIQNPHNKDTSIIDTSIKDNKDIIRLDDIKEIRNKYQGTKCKKDADNKLPKLIKTYGKEQLMRGIDRYIKFVEVERLNGFPTLKFKNESTYWNGGYMDYLDENFKTEATTSKRYSDFGEAY